MIASNLVSLNFKNAHASEHLEFNAVGLGAFLVSAMITPAPQFLNVGTGDAVPSA